MIIKTNLTRNYVPDWTVVDAMRELIQNAIDSDPEGFELTYELGTVTLITNTLLPITSLYMGESSKRGNAKMLGTHGEGLKLALLILLRENRSPLVHSSHRITPFFEQEEYPKLVEVTDPVTGCISLETSFEYDLIEVMAFDCTLSMNINKTIISFEAKQDEWKSLNTICLPKDASYGVLWDKGSDQLYVGGLRISSLDFTYSYNFEPGAIKLERDRRVADTRAVQKEVARIWCATEQWDTIVDGMLKSYYDFEGLPNITLPQGLIDRCVERAKEFEHPPMSYSQSSAKYYGTYVSNSFYAVYSKSSNAVKPPIRKQPKDILSDWFKTNRSYFRKAGAKRMSQLIEESKKWQVQS